MNETRQKVSGVIAKQLKNNLKSYEKSNQICFVKINQNFNRVQRLR